MNVCNILFLFFIGLQQVYCGDGLNWNRLLPEINLLIKNFIRPTISNELPVIKLNAVIDENDYHKLGIHFPATASFKFIDKKEYENTFLKKGLISTRSKPVSRNSLVLPSIQLCVISHYILIRNYELKIFLKKFLKCIYDIRQILFDVKNDKAVYYAKTSSGYILIQCSRGSTYSPICYFENKKEILHSLCVHATDRNEFSIIISENDNNVIKINSFDNLNNIEKGKDIEPQRKFEIPFSIKTIKKHEYIGNNLFLLHCDEGLFFCTEQENRTLNIALQSFFDSKAKQDTNRYSVISFCVNQDIKTPGGKARHFFLLALKNRKYVILHVDLLNTYNTIRKIWSLEQESHDPVFFDRIAFNEEGFCLWKDDEKWSNNTRQNTPAMSIGFCFNWMNILENKTLFETFYENNDQENKKNIMLYEGILNKQNYIIKIQSYIRKRICNQKLIELKRIEIQKKIEDSAAQTIQNHIRRLIAENRLIEHKVIITIQKYCRKAQAEIQAEILLAKLDNQEKCHNSFVENLNLISRNMYKQDFYQRIKLLTPAGLCIAFFALYKMIQSYNQLC